MHDLKKCPFCGGEAYLCASTYDGHIHKQYVNLDSRPCLHNVK